MGGVNGGVRLGAAAAAGEFGEQGLEAGIVGGDTEVKVEAGRVGGERGEGGGVGLEFLLDAGAASGSAAGGDGRGLSGGDEGLEGGEGVGVGVGGSGAEAGGGEVGGAVAMGVEEGVKSVGTTGGKLPVDGAVAVGAGVISKELFGEVAGDGGRGGLVVSAVKLVGDEVKVGGEIASAEVGREEGAEVGEEVGNGLEGRVKWLRCGRLEAAEGAADDVA